MKLYIYSKIYSIKNFLCLFDFLKKIKKIFKKKTIFFFYQFFTKKKSKFFQFYW